MRAIASCINRHWLPFFSPTGYGYRFDAFANILASLFHLSDAEQQEHVDQFIEHITPKELSLIPAFYPVIEPKDSDWEDLQMVFSHTFKNRPFEFHNSGLWPMLTGFYIADLAQRNKQDVAHKYLSAIDQGNAMTYNDAEWSFPEYFHGRLFTPGGTKHQGWSAAASIIGHHTLEGGSLFRIDGSD